jgi:hypothetical protein
MLCAVAAVQSEILSPLTAPEQLQFMHLLSLLVSRHEAV